MKKIILVSRCSWTLYNFRAGLMRTLVEKGYTLVSAGATGDGFDKKINALGIPFIPLPIKRKSINPLGDIKLIFELFKLYRKERPDIVHHFTIKPVIYGSIAARLAKVPKIVNTITGLGFVFADETNVMLKRIVEILYRISLAFARWNFFLNRDDLKLFFLRRLVDSKTSVLIPGEGVDTNFFSPVDQNRLGPVTFLMISRILKDKGVYEFIEAARIIKKNKKNTVFWMAGERDDRNPNVVPLKDIEKWESEGIVSWLGKVKDVRPIISESDVIVLPSYYREGVPKSLLEGAAMEKPLITTKAVGCCETVEDGVTGLLIPVKDPEALAGAMNTLIEHPEMRIRMGKEGRRKMKREFEEKDVIRKILKVYPNVGVYINQS